MVPRANATRGLRSFPVVLRVTCVLALLVVTWIPVTEAVICRDSYKCNCTGIKGGAGYPGIPGLQGPEGPPGDIGRTVHPGRKVKRAPVGNTAAWERKVTGASKVYKVSPEPQDYRVNRAHPV